MGRKGQLPSLINTEQSFKMYFQGEKTLEFLIAMVLVEIKCLHTLNANKSCQMIIVWTPLELMELLNLFDVMEWGVIKLGFTMLRYNFIFYIFSRNFFYIQSSLLTFLNCYVSFFKDGLIRHVNSGRCLSKPESRDVTLPVLRRCDGSSGQQWIMKSRFKWQATVDDNTL